MTTIFHPDHPHYAVHKQFVEGSFANPDSPPVVEYKTDPTVHWSVTDPASWYGDYLYRIKPRTVTRTVTYPEPLREAPARGREVWFVYSHAGVRGETWLESSKQIQLLKNGMVFTTEADAQQCYDALFGEQK